MARGPVDLSRRCARCIFPKEACICAIVPRLATRTRFLVLRHASELSRPTNSGRWAALALANLRLVDYAVDREPLDVASLVEPGDAVLFPSPHPPRLDPPPSRVLVLDGTWAQARRMIQRIPALQELPRLSILAPAVRAADPASAARPPMRRRPTVRGGVSTLEAIAGALHLLGEPDAARALDALQAEALARAWRLRRPA
jgi:DTW domain-containing protein YfiP